MTFRKRRLIGALGASELIEIATAYLGATLDIDTPATSQPFAGMKENQIFRKEIQAGWNKFQIRRNEIQTKILTFLRRIESFQ
jgi:hypothetical protein